MRTLGLDLGGTNIKVAVVELRDPPAVRFEEHAETHAELGPDAVLERMAVLAREAIAAAGPVVAAGIGAPGPLDMEAGRAVFMANLPGWENRPIVAPLAERLRLPVLLINDVRAYTLAEHRLGAGRGVRDMVCFALGTGVGGGVVVGGELLLNLGGTTGELGHQTIEPEGLPCPCGNRGCLEQYVSGPAIARAAGAADADEVITAARNGDRAAAETLERAGSYLGIGIANVVLTVGPERVVIGGGVAEAGDLLFEPARRELARRIRVMPIERVSIVPALLGQGAGAIGAALWGARAARDGPL
jgi:glucokinase